MPCTRVAALVLAVSTFAASGCGESTKSSSQATSPASAESSNHTESTAQTTAQITTQTKTLTRSELIAMGDGICQRVLTKLSSKPVQTAQDAARLEPQNAAYEQTALGELSKLTPPASLTNDWKQILASIQTTAHNTAKLGEYAKANDVQGMRRLLITTGNGSEHTVAKAKHDGFKVCERIL